MDGLYGHHSTAADFMMSPENPMMMMIPPEYHHSLISPSERFPMYGSHELISTIPTISEAASATATAEFRITTAGSRRDLADYRYNPSPPSFIKAKIASHPYYPKLLQAYIDCQKVGAPPEIASLLDEIRRENDAYDKIDAISTSIGADPELDEFMQTYCDILVKYKSDLSRPFDEAASFLSKIETQLSNLCKDDSVVSSDEEFSGGEIDLQDVQTRTEDRELKDRLLQKFGSHISKLKMEFSKKKKKGKLPKEARQTLLEWWKVHNKWPYPTEADKNFLAESTSLDQKQINNWFINQRKRHWKPSEDMQLAVMDSISGPYYATDD